MTVEGTTETLTDQAQRPPASGLSLHGALWTHLLLFCLRILPVWLCEWLARPVVGVVYLLAGEARRGLCANLEALFPEDGPLLVWVKGWRVFLNFGLTYLDRLLHLHLGRRVQWEAVGENCVSELREEPGGALIFTIHPATTHWRHPVRRASGPRAAHRARGGAAEPCRSLRA
ncbi:MAG: hypothetical protein R3F13_04415 [Prosthecobacter sp.]